MHHAVLYTSSPFLHNYDVKWPNFKFFWGLERQGDKLYHLCNSELGRGLLSSSNLNFFLLSKRATWKNREMVWKKVESIFQWRFHRRSRCRIVRSLLPLEQLRPGLQTGSLIVHVFKKTLLWHYNIFGVEVWLVKIGKVKPFSKAAANRISVWFVKINYMSVRFTLFMHVYPCFSTFYLVYPCLIVIIKVIIIINYHKKSPRILWDMFLKSLITLTILYVEDCQTTTR